MNSNTKKFASIIFKGTISSTIVTSSTQLIGIILLPVFTFYLTPEDYGIVSIVSMIVLILSHLTNPGILTATNRLFHNTKDINEKKLLMELPTIQYKNFQGTHWQPSLIKKDTWNKVGGFSEEFSPGLGSDPDFNFKLWNIGCRIFKGLGDCRVYHFSSQ